MSKIEVCSAPREARTEPEVQGDCSCDHNDELDWAMETLGAIMSYGEDACRLTREEAAVIFEYICDMEHELDYRKTD